MEIYIPPNRAQKAASVSLGLAPELPNDLGVLEDAAKEIETAVAHLKRSNKEIQVFDPNGEDPELVEAIAGNIEALARKEERLKTIRDKIASLCANGDPCCHNVTDKAHHSKEPEHTQDPASSQAPASAAAAAGAAAGRAISESRMATAVGLSDRMRSFSISELPPEEEVGGVYL